MNDELKQMTIAEMLESTEFKTKVSSIVQSFRNQIIGRSIKSHPARTLHDQLKLNAGWILDEIPNVINKVSSEPSAVRMFIDAIAKDAAAHVLMQKQREYNLKLAEEVRKKRKEAKENVQAIPGK